ncbi:MAG TPA: N-acetylmuramoyl-L-alanine amidase, partial [Armatimonadota bacterium]|nr:N-acetylmuramoyl-L-alanine amidase [Armatimonadota bacterium]
QTRAQIVAIQRRRNPLLARGDRHLPGDTNPELPPIDLGPITPGAPGTPDVERPEPAQPFRGTAARSLIGKCIVVDAGHGGHDQGAPGKMSKEKNLTLQMCNALKQELEARGARVVMTRSTDDYVSLQQRVDIANGCGADLFISIHLNAMPRPNMQSGSETYFHTPQSVRLARTLHNRLVGTVQGRDGGIRNRRFYVVRNTSMPSVLLEVGYINSDRDEAFLVQDDFQDKLARNLALGVLEYFGSDSASN